MQIFTSQPQLLTDPFLLFPTPNSIQVVWFTEFAGNQNIVNYGEDLANSVIAETTQLSRTYEDYKSQIINQETINIIDQKPVRRTIWRHAATVTNLLPNQRLPYRVTSEREDGFSISSKTFTLAPQATPGTALKILLTSDHQLMPMTAANLQKVTEAIGPLDAIFLAGDLVNIPDRASEWFDDQRGGSFFPCLQGKASYQLEKNGIITTYKGGELIQNAPLFPAIGNHEVMGRFSLDASLNDQFNNPYPRQFIQALTDDEEQIKNNSFNSDTYEEIFGFRSPLSPPLIRGETGENPPLLSREIGESPLLLSRETGENPPLLSRETGESPLLLSRETGESPPLLRETGESPPLLRGETGGINKYYAVTYGDIRLVVLYITNIWRTPNLDPLAKGRYRERDRDFNNPENWGYGQHIFEPISPGSQQYNWLQQELNSNEFQQAKYKIVMFHHPPHTLGDNIVPPYTDPVQIIDRYSDSTIKMIRYEYPKHQDYIIKDVLPLLEKAQVQLVFYGHSHLWNRFISPSGMHFLESSNVGNSYGAAWGDKRRIIPPAFQEDYTAIGDPNGLQPVVPTLAPLIDQNGQTLPYISSNDITAFSIFDTESGQVSSYYFDTRQPDSSVVKFDEFSLKVLP